MDKILPAALAAKHTHHLKKPRTVAIIVKRGQQVLVEKIAPALRVVREDGKPPRVEVVQP